MVVGGVLETVVLPVAGGTAVGTGIYYCPYVGTQTMVQPTLTKLCNWFWPSDQGPPNEDEGPDECEAKVSGVPCKS